MDEQIGIIREQGDLMDVVPLSEEEQKTVKNSEEDE